jgi:N4-gp56 family major capsid protein
MSNTVSIDALRREAWRKELFADVMDDLYFMRNGLMGEGTNNIVQVMNDVKKAKGDTVTFGLSLKLSEDGVTGDSELEGNEEAITTYSQSVSIDQNRNAVRLTGLLDEQKASYDMRKDAKEKLGIWIKEFIERNVFLKLGGITSTDLTDVNGTTYSGRATWSNSPNIVPTADEVAGSGSRYIRAATTGTGDGLDDLAAADIMDVDEISKARYKAKLASPMIRPIRVQGKDYYAMFVHPYQAFDIKNQSSSVWAQAQREAQVRGDSNPIFTGALGIWDGVILYEHEYVPTVVAANGFSASGTAAGVRAYRALLCGQQAAVMAQTNRSMFIEDETFDYGNKVGYATGIIGGIQKAAFNSVDYGVVAVDSSSSVA